MWIAAYHQELRQQIRTRSATTGLRENSTNCINGGTGCLGALKISILKA